MRFIRGIWHFLVGVKDALALVFLLLLFGGLLLIARGGAPVHVPQGSALVLHLEGYVVDQAAEQSPLAMLSGGGDIVPEREVRDVLKAIDRAARDKRIKSLVLQLDNFYGAGEANLQAMRSALQRFKATGKPVFAYGTAYLDDGYYLAAQANEAWLNPLGAVLLTGPGGASPYFSEALDKLSVDVEVFRVGSFKSAVEPFMRSDASPEARAADQALVDTLWDIYVSDVEAARPKVQLDAMLANLPAHVRASDGNFARTALRQGLIDRIGTYGDMGNRVRKLVGKGADDMPGAFNHILLDDYLAGSHGLDQKSGPSVGIVYVAGEIVDGHAPRGMAGGDSIAEVIADAMTDDNIKALVVRVDSPGGSVMASEKIRQALAVAKAEGLPIVASFGPVAASGGYWIATAADEIHAQPSTITGSIGVFAVLPTFKRTLEKVGIRADGVKSTPYSGEPDLMRGLSDDTRLLLQASVEDIYRRFTGLVAASRKLPVSRVDEIAQGRVWAGATAHQLKLIDHFGDLDSAVRAAARRAGLNPATVDTVILETEPPLPFLLLETLFASSEQGQPDARDPWARLAYLGRMQGVSAFADALLVAKGPTIQARCLACTNHRPPSRALPDPAAAKALLSEVLRTG